AIAVVRVDGEARLPDEVARLVNVVPLHGSVLSYLFLWPFSANRHEVVVVQQHVDQALARPQRRLGPGATRLPLQEGDALGGLGGGRRARQDVLERRGRELRRVELRLAGQLVGQQPRVAPRQLAVGQRQRLLRQDALLALV